MAIEPEALSLLFENIYYKEQAKSGEINTEIIPVNNKRVFLVFDKLPNEEEKSFLSKILAAAKINDDEIEIFIEKDFDIIKKNFGGVAIFWCDDENESEKYKVVKNENITVLKSDILSKISTNQLLKAKLWNCLKNIFIE